MANENMTDPRRVIVLVLAVVLLVTCGFVTFGHEPSGSTKFLAAATGRIGLVLSALWLAWPSLRRPAQWLPPGFAFLGILMLCVLAAQPRMIFVLVPAFGGLMVLATVVRTLNR